MEEPQIEVRLVPAPTTEPMTVRGKEKSVSHTQKGGLQSQHLIIALLGCAGVMVWIILF